MRRLGLILLLTLLAAGCGKGEGPATSPGGAKLRTGHEETGLASGNS